MANGVVATFSGTPNKRATGIQLQGGGSGIPLQGSSPNLQGSSPKLQGSSPQLQVTANPMDFLTIGGGGGGTSVGATTTGGSQAAAVDPAVARRAALLNELMGRRSAVDEAYNALFGDLDTLLRSRAGELETQYGGQLKKAGEEFADVLPTIDASYAALGSYDSTQRGDSRGKAKKGYEDTVATIGQNKAKDEAALGQYGKESRAKFQADKDAALRYIDSSAGTTDEGALRDAKNNLDTNLSQTGVTRASLGTDASAQQSLRSMTADNGRFQAAIDSLDAIVKSSMPTDVKQAAVTAVTNSAGLSDEDKKKVQAQYGNVYAEQATL